MAKGLGPVQTPRCTELLPVLWPLGTPRGTGTRAEGLRRGPGDLSLCQPRAQGSSAPAPGKGVREGAADSRARRSSPFFLVDPGKGGRLGVGPRRGGFPPACERGLAPLGLGAPGGRAEARRRHEPGAASRSGAVAPGAADSEGSRELPPRIDAPGGALHPRARARAARRLSNLGTRGRAGRPGPSRGRPRPRPPGPAPRGWQREVSPLSAARCPRPSSRGLAELGWGEMERCRRVLLLSSHRAQEPLLDPLSESCPSSHPSSRADSPSLCCLGLPPSPSPALTSPASPRSLVLADIPVMQTLPL